jgi:hypothetical protein
VTPACSGTRVPGSGASQVTKSSEAPTPARAKSCTFSMSSPSSEKSGSAPRSRRSISSLNMPMGCRWTTIWWRIASVSRCSKA